MFAWLTLERQKRHPCSSLCLQGIFFRNGEYVRHAFFFLSGRLGPVLISPIDPHVRFRYHLILFAQSRPRNGRGIAVLLHPELDRRSGSSGLSFLPTQTGAVPIYTR